MTVLGCMKSVVMGKVFYKDKKKQNINPLVEICECRWAEMLAASCGHKLAVSGCACSVCTYMCICFCAQGLMSGWRVV